MVQSKERRRFVRHPICSPLEFEHIPKKVKERSHTINISEGGLLFLSRHSLHNGELIMLKLPVQNKLFRVRAKVVHVNKDADTPDMYDVGVSFYRYSDAFKVKLIEQMYLIDEYRVLRALQLGRDISFEEASREWIKRYSKRFDRLFWGSKRKHKEK